MNVVQYIKEHLHEPRMLCPFCHGGSSGERSFVVNPSQSGHRGYYKCYRNSCGERGVVDLGRGVAWPESNSNTAPVLEGYADGDCKYNFINSYDCVDYVGKRYRFTVRDSRGEVAGYVLRSAESSHPKTINLLPDSYVGLHFPSPVQGDSIVLVEDIPSAELGSQYFPCCALLGTQLTEEKMKVLVDNGIGTVIIALDYDATSKALRLRRKYAFNLQVLRLTKDLKDCSHQELLDIKQRIDL